MAIGAAELGESARARLYSLWIVDFDAWLVRGVPLDRGGSHAHQRPFHGRKIRLGPGHAVEAAEEKDPGADRAQDCKQTDEGQESHGRVLLGEIVPIAGGVASAGSMLMLGNNRGAP